MGTRSLTMVILNGETKVAQYGQWDGHPETQGVKIYNFLKKHRKENYKTFKEVLTNNVSFISKDELFKLNEKVEQDKPHSKEENHILNFLSRDHGGNILDVIMEHKDEKIQLADASDFGYDGLFCEWAYVIDLDRNQLEIHKGFFEGEMDPNERFYPSQEKIEEHDLKPDLYGVRNLMYFLIGPDTAEYGVDFPKTEVEFIEEINNAIENHKIIGDFKNWL